MPVERKVFVKVSDRIRVEIENAIKDGHLLPGDAIDEAALAGQYGVSRTPVREALIQLQAREMVVSLPRGGMVVAKMGLQQLLSLWELLAELEGIAVRLACQRMTPDEFKVFEAHHRASAGVVSEEDVAGWQQSNLRFHDLIYRAARNPFLRQEVLRIRTRTGFYRKHAFAALGQIRSSFDQHERVVEALRRRDAAGATEAMVAHMRPAHDAQGFTDVIVHLPPEMLASTST